MDNAYFSLIKSWHIKASEDDFFIKFIFEYLALTATLQTQLYPSEEGRTDRAWIQKLKQDSEVKEKWLEVVAGSSSLQETLEGLVEHLKLEPLAFDVKWWNCNGDSCNNSTVDAGQGCLKDERDYENLIEFWYTVRNNLFHGRKSPVIERDKALVRFAYLSLSRFMEDVLISTIERNIYYPASWEDFFIRFFKGEAEVQDRHGRAGSVYEIVLSDDRDFPLVLMDRVLTREDLINGICLYLDGDVTLTRAIRGLEASANSDDRRSRKDRYFGEVLNRNGIRPIQ